MASCMTPASGRQLSALLCHICFITQASYTSKPRPSCHLGQGRACQPRLPRLGWLDSAYSIGEPNGQAIIPSSITKIASE
ncbi:hypothetical protein P389DRAFT_61748 [Cystobasidium minutum MCA 4210]|uniref:uncharacterized protein n=1 Tax=Cystobasidium minutum MCA 4210 TaxID=1397322 RepID=UPI0034CE24A1|eukprot:jgi/Rhomi1/61748/CE61747_55